MTVPVDAFRRWLLETIQEAPEPPLVRELSADEEFESRIEVDFHGATLWIGVEEAPDLIEAAP